jgi:hypothetical protein
VAAAPWQLIRRALIVLASLVASSSRVGVGANLLGTVLAANRGEHDAKGLALLVPLDLQLVVENDLGSRRYGFTVSWGW